MAEYQLYCFAQSGNAYKAALMLQLCGADWEARYVDFMNGETRGEAYRGEINEMGEAPVLLHGGEKLTQSGVILDYLAERFGRFGWENDAERREIYRWILFDNHKFTSYLATYRFLTFFLKTGETPVTEFLRGRLLAALGIVEKRLSGRDWIVLERPSIADLSLSGYLFWPEETGLDWADYPAIAAWLQRLKGLPGWVHPYALMPGHPLPEKG